MGEYRWNAKELGSVFVLPGAIAEHHLRLAGAVQLKVLLWFAKKGLGTFDAEECKDALGVSAPDCADALQYWVQAGVLTVSGTEPAPEKPKAPKKEKPAAPKLPAPVTKPRLPDVMTAKKKHGDFAYLLETASARLGRVLTPGDMETFLYLYESIALPAEVLLMIVEYAVQTEHFSIRYIEKTALNWAEDGITDMARAERRLLSMERQQQALCRVRTACGVSATALPSTVSAAQTVERWVYEWKLNDEIIRLAQEVCEKQIGKFQLKYIDRILGGWHEDGIDTAEKAKAALAPQKGKKAVPVTKEQQAYEDMVRQHLPVYKKKKKE